AYILATGRRLPYLYSISLDAALDPTNNGTGNAIIARNKVALDRFDGQLVGDPANLILNEDGTEVYVVNHHGAIDNGEFLQHGGRGQIAVLDVAAALDPRNDRTANALLRHLDSGAFGAVGIALTPETLIVSNAENNLTEDGGNRVTFVDRRTGSLRHTVELALGTPAFTCEEYPVPHVAPYGPPSGLALQSRDPGFGCFPNPNGLAIGMSSEGRSFIFTANGGTNDVSVIDLDAALRGDKDAEIHRIPTQIAPWGISATPDASYIIVSNAGSQQLPRAGNSLSILDVDLASRRSNDAEVARVLVGTDNSQDQTHPFITTVTPDGEEIVVPNYRADSVSIVNLGLALANDAGAEVARIPLQRADGGPARPKGSAITRDGRYAVVSGGAGSLPYANETGYIYIIDIESRQVVSTITGIGNDPYGLTIVYR
ncbi:MAG: hypothetical protein MI746_02110, partial [Pseudomonadales bacterium]|nr:hypothetical protein [Pseudomonadales bacterium]